jgi:hypothetical protein
MISTKFENLSFHDASIESIERKSDSIIVKLCGVFVSREHPWAQGKDWTFDVATLKLLGVSGEEAKFWDDTKAPKVHPEPDMPLDEIMHAKFENGIFHFDGFKETMPWYEWFVTADRFELEMDVQNEKSS